MDSGKQGGSGGRRTRAEEIRRASKLLKRMLTGLKGRLDDELRVKGVTSAQIRFLSEVKQHPGATGAQLARACPMTPQSAQAMMARAVAQGWVVRGKDAENERLVTARLTPAGERLLAYTDAVFARVEDEVWAGVSAARIRAMNDLLEHGLGRLEP